jgi:hypothetical protein
MTGRRTVALLASLALACVVRSVWGQTDDAQGLVTRVLEARPRTSFIAQATLRSESRGWTRELTLRYKRLGDVDASFLEVTDPLDVKDTRFLLLDRQRGTDEQYIYVPALGRTLQVAESTRKQPFLGSDFYVSDMVRPDPDAYEHSFTGEEVVGGRPCKLIQSTAKNPDKELYGKTVFAIDPAELVLMRTQFFDADGKPVKVWTMDQLEKIDGVNTPRKQTMKNVQEGTESTLEINEIQYNAEIPDDLFQRSELSR